MGRIAYLSKRGNLWWFRRRHPVIFFQAEQSIDVAGTCGIPDRRAQARGHLAVSLQTASVREARQLAARLSAHFEVAWASVEARVIGNQDQDDILDGMASMLTEGFRRYIEHYRATGVAGMAPDLRERAFARLDAELRVALGITPLPYADILNRVHVRRPIKYIVLHDADPTVPATPDEECMERLAEEAGAFGPEEERLVRAEAAAARSFSPSDVEIVDVEDEDTGERIGAMVDGISRLVEQYVSACEKEGLDPRAEVPGARQLAQSLANAARRLGAPMAVEVLPSTQRSQPEPEYSSEVFTDFAKRYLALRCQGYALRREDESPDAKVGINFERTSLRNWQSSVRVFSELVGDLPLRDITKDDVVEFNTLIQRLPANFGKSSRDDRSARQVIEYLDEEERYQIAELAEKLRREGKPPAEIEDALARAVAQRISATTIKRHQTALQSIFEYALSQRLIAKNPFKGLLLTEAEVKRRKLSAARVERTGWGDAIYDLLGSEIYTEPLKDIGDPLFWAPLIAVFSGLRLEEICQLRIRDFIRDDGVLFVAVQNELGNQLNKSQNAVRRVPLHRALIDIGLPQLVEYRRQSGNSRLFPDMPRSKSKGTLSAIMSKRFGYYIRSRGIKDEGLDFHALRTEFLVRLTRAKAPEHVRRGLMGHEQRNTTDAHYFRAGEEPKHLQEYVDRIDIDYRGIRPPFGGFQISARPPLRVAK